MKISHVSKQAISIGEEIKASEIRDTVFNLIKADHPDFDLDCYISIDELNQYRRLYLTSIYQQEKGELAVIVNDVMDAIQNNAILTEIIQDDVDEEQTLGQKVADIVASFGGSWTFIIIFFSFIMIWMLINVWFLEFPTVSNALLR
jgi:hypothetical protein